MSKREQAAEIIHEQWKKRNTWAKNTDLYKSYKDLPQHEKNKDRRHVDVVLAYYKKGFVSKYALKSIIPAILHQQWLDAYKRENKGPRWKQYKDANGNVICECDIAVEYGLLSCEQSKTENIAASVAAINAVFKVYGLGPNPK